MKKFTEYSFALQIAYLVAWTLPYIGVMLLRGDLDFGYFIEYFLLAWTFNGFELPTFIWILSLVLFLPLAGFAVRIVQRGKKGGDRP